MKRAPRWTSDEGMDLLLEEVAAEDELIRDDDLAGVSPMDERRRAAAIALSETNFDPSTVAYDGDQPPFMFLGGVSVNSDPKPFKLEPGEHRQSPFGGYEIPDIRADQIR
jgi:hypothetical protein